MNNNKQKKIFTSCVLLFALAGCKALSGGSDQEGIKLIGGGKVSGRSLEVPPELSNFERNGVYSDVVSAAQVASGVTNSNTTQPNAVSDPLALATPKGMKIVKDGSSRWIELEGKPSEIWPKIEAFWTESGFPIGQNSSQLGIIETDWINPKDGPASTGLRQIVGKAISGLYDSGYRDKYRTRMEVGNEGKVEVFVTHRGMEEVFSNSNREDLTWQVKGADEQKEAVMLRRLMLALGATDVQAAGAIQSPEILNKSVRVEGDTIVVSDTMENAWRRVGLIMDRSGFTIKDRDFNTRTYIISPDPKDKGLFRRSFGSSDQTYRLQLVEKSPNQIVVKFIGLEGGSVSDSDVKRVIKTMKSSLD